MTSDPCASLKCVIAWSDARNLCSLIERELEGIAGAGEVLRLNDEAYVVWSNEAASTIRDHLIPTLERGESLFVSEFEAWSSHGAGVDSTWLLRRGH